MNSKGQFSVIAALLVAVVLVAAVMATYSAINYGSSEEQPQILSSIDETNLGLKELLGFTVGYYGSVIKVTGNMTYAQQLAKNYLQSGLNNIGNVRPELGASINLINLTLKANWYSDESFSQGQMYARYNLTGKGIYGASYNTSARLDVQIQNSPMSNQAELVILRDEAEPLINLGKNNLKIYQYDYEKSVWNLVSPPNIASYANGTYILDLPEGVTSDSYAIEVSDTRGLMVVASSFTQYTSSVAWNSTPYRLGCDYVDESTDLIGLPHELSLQQNPPDGYYDTLTEAAHGLVPQPCYPTSWSGLGSTSLASGSLSDLQSNNGIDMTFHSYGTTFEGQNDFGYSAVGYSTQSIDNNIRGSQFTIPADGRAQSITVYLELSGTSNRPVKTAIYSSSHTYITETEEQIVTSSGWVTFNFSDPKPNLSADTDYILVAWSNNPSGDVLLRYNSGATNQGHRNSRTYGDWPASVGFSHESRQYSIYCTYAPANQYTAQVEFTGSSSTPLSWTDLAWLIDSSTSTNNVAATFQLYNYNSGAYPTSGDGYLTTTLGTSDLLSTQTVITNYSDFFSSGHNWKILVTATKTTSTPFDLNLDLVEYAPEIPNYALNIEEQWLNVDTSYPRQDLCIKTGDLGSEPLQVQVLQGSSWVNLMTLVPNHFNNASLSPYINSETLVIRFVGSNDVADPTPDSYDIDCVYIKDEPDITFLVNRQQSSFTVEVLQNGTMRWLGQDLEVTTKTIPVPPVPVKAIHINQTICGVNQEVPFQIEDWASNYQIPLGLTSNTTVFSNRQMIVFLLNSAVTDFTIWWNATDAATQTSFAYTNTFFTNDDTDSSTYNNGNLTLQFINGALKATVAGTSTYSTATFMRINTELSTYGSGTSLVIHHGIVRDIAMEESEWGTANGGGGAFNCPNIYANIIIMLPANSTYYNYQLRLMFIDSSQQRTITDLCPIQLTTSVSSTQLQTENSTVADFPLVVNGSATYPNVAGIGYTDHHFMQFIADSSKGAGIMFSDAQNSLLYAFNGFPSSTSKGALRTSSGLLELLPVAFEQGRQVQFNTAYDITWKGAVATWDSQTPICNFYDSTTPMGLWILAEYPPTLTTTASS